MVFNTFYTVFNILLDAFGHMFSTLFRHWFRHWFLMSFLTHFYAKIGPKMTLRSFKFTQVESQRAPKCTIIDTFLVMVVLGTPWLHLACFWHGFCIIFIVSGPPFGSFWQLLHPFRLSFLRNLKNWGGGRGWGKAQFPKSHFSAPNPFQHHNLWLARCGLALQLG